MRVARKETIGILLAFALACGFAVPSMAWATVEGDQTPATDEEIAAALADGSIKTEAQEPAVQRGSEEGAAVQSSAKVASSVSVSGYAGDSMFETAAAEAKAAYPFGSKTAIIVGPGDSWIDALSAAGLSASKGPILFTQRDSLYPATQQALKDLGVESVIIMGGTAAVSDTAERAIEDAGFKVEARLGGQDCYDTQMKIYQYGLDNNLWDTSMAIVSTGMVFGDALSVSPTAYAKKAPIVLCYNAELPDAQKAALSGGAMQGKFTSPAIVGGEAAVSGRAERFVEDMTIKNRGSYTRLWGASQYETSSAIAKWAVSSQGFSWNNAAFTTGLLPYDALAGSVLQGVSNSVLLLVSDPWIATVKEASVNKGSISSIRFFGGAAAISPSLRTYIGSSISDTISYENAGISLSKMAGLEGVSSYLIDPDSCGCEDSEFYQFAVLNSGYSGKVTAAQVDAFIAKKCVYSESKYGVTSKLRGTGQYFIDAAKSSGVNEVYLLTHAILESAYGCSNFAQGSVAGYEGYYNFFGIKAYDSNPNQAAIYAKQEGWSTQQKAIEGGAKWIAQSPSRYLNNAYNQNTLYKMRWNYEQAARENAVWKQYATSKTWATGIANVMANFYSYASIDKSNTGLKFLVPLYS
ncbi:MAG: cell wall-binding repeat-containing protein [Bacteroides sp.]